MYLYPNIGESNAYDIGQLSDGSIVAGIQVERITEEKFLGNDNLQEVYELTDNIARRFYMYLKRNSVGEDIYIDGSPTFDKVEETQTENRLAGWLLNFSVGVPNPEIDICVNP